MTDLSWLTASIAAKTDVNKSDLLTAFQAIDASDTGALAAIAGKAEIVHVHAIDAIVDLTDALSDRVRLDGGQASNLLLKGATQFALGGIDFTSGVLTLDFTDGAIFRHTLAANVTSIVLQDVPAATGALAFKMVLSQDGTGSRTVAFPSNWSGASGSITAPSSGANTRSIYEVWSYDSGQTWTVERASVGSTAPTAPTLNGDLAYSGLFYGNAWGGTSAIGNQPIRWSGTNNAFQICAAILPIYKTGNLTHVRFNNRTNNAANGETGYGDGGCVAWQELRKVKTDGTPDMTVGGLLGRTADYDPQTVGGVHLSDANFHPKMAWQSPIAVVAGVDVAFVWRNSTQDNTKFASANFHVDDKPLTPRGGPALGGRKVLMSVNDGTSWFEPKRGGDSEPSRGMYRFFGELHYSDGIVHGNPYRFANVSALEYAPLVDGTNNAVRQKFKMRASIDFVAGAVWLRLFSESAAPTLVMSLYNLGGSLIEAVNVPASLITKMTSTTDGVIAKIQGSPRGNPNAGTAAPIQWFRVPLAASRTLTAGSSYEVRLTAGAGSKIRIYGVLNSNREGVYEALECFQGTTSQTQGEYTTDNGSTWTKVVAANGTGFSYDFPVLFEKA